MALPVHSTTRYQSHHSASHETALLDGLCEVRRGHGSLLPAAPSSSSRRAHVSLPPAALTTQPTMTALLDAGSRIGGMALCNGGEVGHGFMQWGRGGTWLYAMGERRGRNGFLPAECSLASLQQLPPAALVGLTCRSLQQPSPLSLPWLHLGQQWLPDLADWHLRIKHG